MTMEIGGYELGIIWSKDNIVEVKYLSWLWTESKITMLPVYP